MAITLQKGQGVSLRKESGYDLSRLTVGLGWDIAPSTPAYDLDAVAFLLDGDGKVRNLGKIGANGRPTTSIAASTPSARSKPAPLSPAPPVPAPTPAR